MVSIRSLLSISDCYRRTAGYTITLGVIIVITMAQYGPVGDFPVSEKIVGSHYSMYDEDKAERR